MVRVFIIGLILITNTVLAQQIVPMIQTGHLDMVTSMQFIDSDEKVLTASLDETLSQWDIHTQVQDERILNLKGGVSCFKFNESAELLVVGTYNKQVLIYDFKDTTVFGPKWVYDFTYHVKFLDINDDGTSIVASSGYTITVLDNFGNKRLAFGGDDIMGLRFAKDNNTVYFGNYDGDIYRFNVLAEHLGKSMVKVLETKENISEIALSEDNRFLAYGTSVRGNEGGNVGIYDLKKKKMLGVGLNQNYIIYLGAQYNSLHFIGNKELVFVDRTGGISVWNFKKNKTVQLVKNQVNSGIAISKNKKWLAYAIDHEAKLVKLDNVLELVELKGDAENPIRFAGLYKNKLIVEYPTGMKKWNLADLKAELVEEKFYEHDWSHIAYSKDLELKADHLDIRNILTGEFLDYYIGVRSKSRFGAFSNDKNFYAFLTEDGELVVKCFDTTGLSYWSEKDVKIWNYNASYAQLNIDDIVMHPSKNELVVLAEGFDFFNLETGEYRRMTNRVRKENNSLPALFDPVQNKLLVATSKTAYDTFAYQGAKGYVSEWKSIKRDLIGTKKARYLNTKSGTISIYEMDSFTAPYYLRRDHFIADYADVSAMEYDAVNHRILIGYSDGTLKVLNTTDSGYYLHDYTKFSSGVEDIILSEDGFFLFIINKFGAIGMLENSSLTYLVSLASTKNNEFIAFDLDGYYKRSKNAMNAVAFKQGDYIFRINQVDRVLNKPHLVYEQLGLVGEEKLAMIQKLSYNNERRASIKLIGPKIEIVKRNRINLVSEKDYVKIKTEASFTKANLDYIKVWTNGIPLFAEGEEPRASSTKRWTKKWKLPLKRGKNTIRFVCFDENGTGSQEEIIVINCIKPYEKPNLYVAIVSVSDYEVKNMNLRYAVKDGRDFAEVYIDSIGKKQIGFPSRFGKVYLDTFFNENAIRENVLEWKQKLKNSKPEDYVLLYVSGHGLLDTSFNFWFATHDVDFENPSKRGMSFNHLEELLVAIPAQQKLFLMDACHSGEVIKDELVVDSTFKLPDGSKGELIGYSYRGADIVEVDGTTIDRGELKQELFSNYDSKSGATVVSAAAGNSFALESPDWNNGIFTYTVIGGLVNRWADVNNDGEISVVELSRYVTKMVKEQTGGLQIPNDRQENIENNFRVW
jgi:WD40 repeat protein